MLHPHHARLSGDPKFTPLWACNEVLQHVHEDDVRESQGARCREPSLLSPLASKSHYNISGDYLRSLDFHPYLTAQDLPLPPCWDDVSWGLVDGQDFQHCHSNNAVSTWCQWRLRAEPELPPSTVERIPPSPHTSVAKGDQVGNLGFYFHLAVMKCSPSPARWRQRKPAKTEDFIKNPKTHNEIRKYPVLNRKSLIVPKARWFQTEWKSRINRCQRWDNRVAKNDLIKILK